MFFEKILLEKIQGTKSVIVDKQRVIKLVENLQRSERLSELVRDLVLFFGDSWRSGQGDLRGEEYRKKKFFIIFVIVFEVYRYFRIEKFFI